MVGSRLRAQRLAQHMSEEEFARKLGLTFQQVQNYENGTSGIRVSRLKHISEILGVPIAALFEGTRETELSRSLLALISDSRSFRLGHAFAAIEDRTARLSIVNLVEKIAAAVAKPKGRRK